MLRKKIAELISRSLENSGTYRRRRSADDDDDGARIFPPYYCRVSVSSLSLHLACGRPVVIE